MGLFSLLAPVYDLLPGIFLQRQTATLLTRMSPAAGKTILDLGGGTGRVARYLRKSGADVWLLDSSLPMLKRAGLALPAGRVFHGDAACLPFHDEFFDLVLIVDAFHHFRRQEQSLKESCRVLRTGGSLYILDFTPQSPLVRLLERLERLAGEESLFLTPEAVQALLPARFVLIKTEYLSSREYLLQAKRGPAP
ncbi:MAG: Demethylmenaquinone methyltransferase [Syntrophomonadaceae bacterium]|nr:Demethylmenaquinone methyltransferase [Bacillota bacterium]